MSNSKSNISIWGRVCLLQIWLSGSLSYNTNSLCMEHHPGPSESPHVWMWELDRKESWALTNWCIRTVVLEETLDSLLDCKEIKPVNPKGNLPWIFIGRTDAKAPILRPPDVKNWLIGKRPWCWERLKGMTEDEMVGWNHWLNGHEFEWALGVGDGQGGLVCCSSWGRKELDTTEWLNWTELMELERQGELVWMWRSFCLMN